MARTKRTSKNPQIHRPVTAIGKDVQPPKKRYPTSTKKRRKTTQKISFTQDVEKGNKTNQRT